jgi:hypothetical protein
VFHDSECLPWKPGLVRGYIESAAWQGDALEVVAARHVSCGNEDFRGRVELRGRSLRLFSEPKIKHPVPGCHCTRFLNYRIEGLTKEDYQLSLSWSEDRLLLRSDNSQQDSCSSKPSYECYRDSLRTSFERRLKKRELAKEKLSLSFDTREQEQIISRFPRFIKHFKRHAAHVYSPYCGDYRFRLEELPHRRFGARYRIGVLACGRARALSAYGNSFEDAVQDFLTRMEEDYGHHSLAKRIEERLGFPVLYLSPQNNSLWLLVSGERATYSLSKKLEAEIRYYDRPGDLVFLFPEGPLPELLEREQLSSLLDKSNRAHALLEQSGRFTLPQMGKCVVAFTLDGDRAKLRCLRNRSKGDAQEKVLIHNRTFEVIEPVLASFELSLTEARLEEVFK